MITSLVCRSKELLGFDDYVEIWCELTGPHLYECQLSIQKKLKINFLFIDKLFVLMMAKNCTLNLNPRFYSDIFT